MSRRDEWVCQCGRTLPPAPRGAGTVHRCECGRIWRWEHWGLQRWPGDAGVGPLEPRCVGGPHEGKSVEVRVSTDAEYWSPGADVEPTREDLARLGDLVRQVGQERGVGVEVLVCPGPAHNVGLAREVLDVAWERFCKE